MPPRGGAPEESGGAPVVYLPWVTEPAERTPTEGGAAESALASVAYQPAASILSEVAHELDEADRSDALVLKKLSRHGMSQREVERALATELPPESVALNVARYIRLGYIDDDRLAEAIVRAQRDRKGAGLTNVRRELSMRGIPDGVSERVLADIDDDSELELATELAAQRLRRLSAEPTDVQDRRVTAFLQRRGYGYSTAARAIAEARSRDVD